MSTFFAKANPKFPSPKSDGTIETEPFLLAAKQIVPFFGKLGDNREVANKNYSIQPQVTFYLIPLLVPSVIKGHSPL